MEYHPHVFVNAPNPRVATSNAPTYQARWLRIKVWSDRYCYFLQYITNNRIMDKARPEHPLP